MPDDFKMQLDAEVRLDKLDASLKAMEDKVNASMAKAEKSIKGGPSGNGGLGGMLGTALDMGVKLAVVYSTIKAVEGVGKAMMSIRNIASGAGDAQYGRALGARLAIEQIPLLGTAARAGMWLDRGINGVNETNYDSQAQLAAIKGNIQARHGVNMSGSHGWGNRQESDTFDSAERWRKYNDLRASGAAPSEVKKSFNLANTADFNAQRNYMFDTMQERQGMQGGLMSARLGNAGQQGAAQLVDIHTAFKSAILDAQRDTTDAGKTKLAGLKSLERESLIGSMMANRGPGEEVSLNTAALGMGAARMQGYQTEGVDGATGVLQEILTAIRDGNKQPTSVGRN